MGKPISLFGHYAEPENAVTNYVGVILRLLYQHSPAQFEAMINSWLETQFPLEIGPRFTQQSKRGTTIPDLLIEQQPFCIHVETKLNNQFDLTQLNGHIDAMIKKNGVKVLIALGTQDEKSFNTKYFELIKLANNSQIHLVSLSFDELLESLRTSKISSSFIELIDEFYNFLDMEKLFQNWEYRLTVVNTAGTLEEFLNGYYITPNTGSAYSHQRAKFFGAYKDRKVCCIAEVEGRVCFDSDCSNIVVDWCDENNNEITQILKDKSIDYYTNKCSDLVKEAVVNKPIQIFVLKNRFETSFDKNSRGGLLGAKKYFNDIARGTTTAEELAKKLCGKNWSDFEK